MKSDWMSICNGRISWLWRRLLVTFLHSIFGSFFSFSPVHFFFRLQCKRRESHTVNFLFVCIGQKPKRFTVNTVSLMYYRPSQFFVVFPRVMLLLLLLLLLFFCHFLFVYRLLCTCGLSLSPSYGSVNTITQWIVENLWVSILCLLAAAAVVVVFLFRWSSFGRFSFLWKQQPFDAYIQFASVLRGRLLLFTFYFFIATIFSFIILIIFSWSVWMNNASFSMWEILWSVAWFSHVSKLILFRPAVQSLIFIHLSIVRILNEREREKKKRICRWLMPVLMWQLFVCFILWVWNSVSVNAR